MAKNQTKRISSKDVAREAGVSQSTVSRVYNESGIPVSEDKKLLVLAAAEKLGYRPSLIARSLNQQSTKIIGLVIKNFDNQFYIEALRLFTEAFQKKGYTIMLFNIQDNQGSNSDYLKALEYQVDGIVITSATLDSPLVERFKDYSTPVFLFNRLSDGQQVNTVCCDNVAGGERVAEYLIEMGHKNLIYISGEKGSSTNRDRLLGFSQKAKELGISHIDIVEGDFSYTSGYLAAKKLIASGKPFDGVFCAADYMSLGFMDYIYFKTDLRIPQDFSLVGFDGAPIMNAELYPLTTYRQPLKRMVDKTVELMIQKIKRFTPDPISYLFNGDILERGTVLDRNATKREVL